MSDSLRFVVRKTGAVVLCVLLVGDASARVAASVGPLHAPIAAAFQAPGRSALLAPAVVAPAASLPLMPTALAAAPAFALPEPAALVVDDRLADGVSPIGSLMTAARADPARADGSALLDEAFDAVRARPALAADAPRAGLATGRRERLAPSGKASILERTAVGAALLSVAPAAFAELDRALESAITLNVLMTAIFGPILGQMILTFFGSGPISNRRVMAVQILSLAAVGAGFLAAHLLAPSLVAAVVGFAGAAVWAARAPLRAGANFPWTGAHSPFAAGHFLSARAFEEIVERETTHGGYADSRIWRAENLGSLGRLSSRQAEELAESVNLARAKAPARALLALVVSDPAGAYLDLTLTFEELSRVGAAPEGLLVRGKLIPYSQIGSAALFYDQIRRP
ncbi:MAG: hypothetical protein HY403_00060 [Elusimicrobia bacterium]|nr:hypothetical protein [Elusimicrobiota bacterium]